MLARLCSSEIRKEYAFSYDELEGYAKAAGWINTSGAVTTTFDRMLHAKGEYIWYFTLAAFSGWTDAWGYITHQDIDPAGDQWNRIVGKKMLEEIWFCSEDEASAMGEVSAAEADLLTRVLAEVFRISPMYFSDYGRLETGFVYRQLANALETAEGSWATCVGEMKNSAHKMLLNQSRMEGAVNKIANAAPNVVNVIFTGINAYISYNSYIDAYDSRDVFLENSLADFLADTRYHHHIGDAASKEMKKEFDGIMKDYKNYGTSQVIADSLVSLAVDGAVDALSTPIAIFTSIYRIATGTIPYFKKTLASMDSYMTSLFGLSLEADTEDSMLRRLAGARSWTEEDRMDAIEAAYLYLKTCISTGQLAMEALTSESIDAELNAEKAEMLSDMAIMVKEYSPEDDGSIITLSYQDLMDAYYAMDDSGLIDSVIKLYVTISGDVKNMEDDSPVPDAECNIYGRDNEFINRFHPDEEGKYEKISVPVLEPVYIEENPDLDFMLSFVFTSPTVEGEDELSLKFESGLEKEMKTAYLGGSGAYGVAVEAGGAVYYIKYSMDSHMSPGLTGFFALAANQPNSVVRLKDGEETVLAETPASGRIAAARGQIFFTGEYREDGRTIKAVDMDGGPVKTLCTGELLGVLESGSHIIVSNYTGLYTMDTTPSDTQETYVMNKISSEAGYIANYNDRVIYYETTGNSIYVYSIAAADDDDRLFLGRLEVDFKDSLSGISLGEVRMPVIDGDEYLYISYGTIAGSYIMYQGGRIARFNLNREDSAEILAGTGTLVDADFTVNEDGSVNSYEYQKGRLSAGLYESNTWFYYSRDGILYDISREDGHEEPVLYPEEYAAISNSKIDVNDNGTYLKIYYYTKQDDRLYIYCTLGIANGDGLGWRPSYDLAGGVLIQKDLKTGEVNFLFRY